MVIVLNLIINGLPSKQKSLNFGIAVGVKF